MFTVMCNTNADVYIYKSLVRTHTQNSIKHDSMAEHQVRHLTQHPNTPDIASTYRV